MLKNIYYSITLRFETNSSLVFHLPIYKNRTYYFVLFRHSNTLLSIHIIPRLWSWLYSINVMCVAIYLFIYLSVYHPIRLSAKEMQQAHNSIVNWDTATIFISHVHLMKISDKPANDWPWPSFEGHMAIFSKMI